MSSQQKKIKNFRKRRPPIALSLLKNSKAAMFSAIELHNKPIFTYRYEVTVLLVINSWELLLKAYIYKYLKKVKLFDKEGHSKPFTECLRCVVSNLDKSHKVIQENLEVLYEYRNEIAHFHLEECNVLIYSLLKKSLILYKDFLLNHFNNDITKESDLILLPIGFKKLFSPLDFLSNESALANSSKFVKKFVSSIIESTAKLESEEIEESILIDFSINLTNEKRIKNADIIAGINNERNGKVNIIIENIIKNPEVSPNAKTVLVRSISFTEPPSNDIDEINSWIALSKKDLNLLPSVNELWRIYHIRDTLRLNENQLLELSRFAFKMKMPVFFWIKDIRNNKIKELLENIIVNEESINIISQILHVGAFLGKGFYIRLLNKIGYRKNNIFRLKIPSSGPRSFFSPETIESKRRRYKQKKENLFRNRLIEDLNNIALNMSKRKGKVYDEFESRALDCYLYAKDNKYR